MAALAGILNQPTMGAQVLSNRGATPMAAGGTSSTNGSSGSSATISANDFLTLLVTEMKNQDPTATTDPNEYINQLVNVNSLQQLIAINQTLSSDLTPSVGASSGNTTTPSSAAAAKGATGAVGAATAKLAPGNLSIPGANAAADRVAQSLGGRSGVR
jgi:flagellar basal-body rod modification protein FlgD